MDTASYLARKAIKESYYNERYGKNGWASWVAPAGPYLSCHRKPEVSPGYKGFGPLLLPRLHISTTMVEF